MLKFIQNLLSFNIALTGKARSLLAYDEALALYLSKDFKKALPLMKESAELGHIDAMSLLGSMLLLGQGTKECEFRSKLDTHSTANWTAIPAQTGQ